MMGYEADNSDYQEEETLDLNSIILMGPHIRPIVSYQTNNYSELYQKEEQNCCHHNGNCRVVYDDGICTVEKSMKLKTSLLLFCVTWICAIL